MKPRKRRSWEETALILAETIAACRSQDPFAQVGACAVLRDDSVCLGYNGPPPGIEIDWSEREHRGARVIHAEVNALRSVAPGECRFLAVTLLPCRHCMTFIASKRIKKIVYREIYERDTMAFELAREFRIELVQMPQKRPATVRPKVVPATLNADIPRPTAGDQPQEERPRRVIRGTQQAGLPTDHAD